MPQAISGPYTRPANCWVRANSVLPPTITGSVWIRPTPGWRSIALAIRTIVAPSITLSASSVINWG